MKNEEKLLLLAETMDLDAKDLHPDDLLSKFSEWDSLASLSFMSILMSKCKKRVTPQDVRNLVTVADALRMME